jgi:thioredoxin reductase
MPYNKTMQNNVLYDVIIVGGGPAGLNAALLLGRCRRRVLLCDNGQYRNAASHALHGFLSRDGIEPAELLRLGREQLHTYPNVEYRSITVTDVSREEGKFTIMLSDNARVTSRKLLLTTGVIDKLPEIEGIEALYGQSVVHCPYCDGWEVRDQPMAAYGTGKIARRLVLELTVWSRDLVLCTDGPSDLNEEDIDHISRNGIPIREERIVRLEGNDGQLERIVFANGESLPRRAMFLKPEEQQRSDLAAKLGCDFTSRGVARTGEYEETNVPGLFVAGDASRRVQLAIVAAAEGVEAAYAINNALIKEDTE